MNRHRRRRTKRLPVHQAVSLPASSLSLAEGDWVHHRCEVVAVDTGCIADNNGVELQAIVGAASHVHEPPSDISRLVVGEGVLYVDADRAAADVFDFGHGKGWGITPEFRELIDRSGVEYGLLNLLGKRIRSLLGLGRSSLFSLRRDRLFRRCGRLRRRLRRDCRACTSLVCVFWRRGDPMGW